MANTGFKQATIAYKTTPDGRPLDVEGRLTSVSGKRQAIALLIGRSNPNPTLYEVQTYFAPRSSLLGEPTHQYNTESCPVGYIRVTPSRLTLTPENNEADITLISSHAWQLDESCNNALLNITSGEEGVFNLTLTKTGNLGQCFFKFKNNVTGQIAEIYIINTDTFDWILETGDWNDLGFWNNNGIWNF